MSCPANKNCAEVLAKRVHYLFSCVFSEKVEVLFAYFKLRDVGFYSKMEFIPSLGATIFDKELDEPLWIRVNRWGFNKCRDEGLTMMWMPSDEFLFMGGSGDIIVPENAIRTIDD